MTTEQNPDQNPTMDEILASIRKIVSTDGREGHGEADQAPITFADAQQSSSGDDDDDPVLDLIDALPEAEAPATQVAPPAAASQGSRPATTAPAPASFSAAPPSAQAPVFAPAASPVTSSTFTKAAQQKTEERAAMTSEIKGLVSDNAISAASAAFSALQSEVAVSRSGGGRTLEDIVIELMRPMIKDWLDANLTDIVDEAVRAEIERIAKRRPGDQF